MGISRDLKEWMTTRQLRFAKRSLINALQVAPGAHLHTQPTVAVVGLAPAAFPQTDGPATLPQPLGACDHPPVLLQTSTETSHGYAHTPYRKVYYCRSFNYTHMQSKTVTRYLYEMK